MSERTVLWTCLLPDGGVMVTGSDRMAQDYREAGAEVRALDWRRGEGVHHLRVTVDGRAITVFDGGHQLKPRRWWRR